MTDSSDVSKYEPYDDSYFKMTRSQLKSMELMSVFHGFPYEAPFFGFMLVDDKPHPYAKTQIEEWEKKHGPLPAITIIEDVKDIE